QGRPTGDHFPATNVQIARSRINHDICCGNSANVYYVPPNFPIGINARRTLREPNDRSLGSRQLLPEKFSLIGDLFSLCLNLPVCVVHRVPLLSGIVSVICSRAECADSSKAKNPLHQKYLMVVTLIGLCVTCAFAGLYALWSVQHGPHFWRWAVLLFVSLCGFACGVFLLLDSIGETAQLRDNFFTKHNQSLSENIHEEWFSKTVRLVGVDVVVVRAILGCCPLWGCVKLTEPRPMFGSKEIVVLEGSIKHNKEMAAPELLKFRWSEAKDFGGRGIGVVGKNRTAGTFHKGIPGFIKLGLLSVFYLFSEHPAHYVLRGGFPQVAKCHHNIDSVVLNYRLHRVLGSSIDLYPRSLVFANNIQLFGINASLYSAYHGEDDGEYRDYSGAVACRKILETRYPRRVMLSIGGVSGVVGLFCLIYVSAFLFSEYAIRRGILCMVVGFLLSAFALFLIHEAYK